MEADLLTALACKSSGFHKYLHFLLRCVLAFSPCWISSVGEPRSILQFRFNLGRFACLSLGPHQPNKRYTCAPSRHSSCELHVFLQGVPACLRSLGRNHLFSRLALVCEAVPIQTEDCRNRHWARQRGLKR